MKFVPKIVQFILVISPLLVFGQQSNSSKTAARVIYGFTHVRDTNQLNKVHKEEMMLTFTGSEALYKSYSWYYDDSVSTSQILAGNYKSSPTILGKYSLETWYTRLNPKEFYKIQSLMQDSMAVAFEYPTINWLLINEDKQIGGFNCKRAKGDWKGRTFDVWYTPDIPVPFGPWKLGGLPGLILSASDTKGQVTFEFLGLTNGVTYFENFLKRKRVLTQQEYKSFVTNLAQNPNGVLQGMGGTDGQYKFEKTTPSASANPNRLRNNNPLELTN